jgi:hypothetical protein
VAWGRVAKENSADLFSPGCVAEASSPPLSGFRIPRRGAAPALPALPDLFANPKRLVEAEDAAESAVLAAAGCAAKPKIGPVGAAAAGAAALASAGAGA